MPDRKAGLPPLIAIVGCDGSGKSTVSDALLAWLEGFGPVTTVHLGKQQGNMGRWFAGLPLVGGWFGRFIGKKASTVHKSRGKNKAPDFLPGLVMYAFTLRRVRRYRRMMALREQGQIIIADRYPQLDVPSASDGPDMSVDAQGGRLVCWMARRELAYFQWMTSYRPDLVIRLNVDLDTAFSRKPDHPRDTLERKLKVIPRLTFGGAAIVDIDASQSLEKVVAEAKAAATRVLTQRGFQRRSA